MAKTQLERQRKQAADALNKGEDGKAASDMSWFTADLGKLGGKEFPKYVVTDCPQEDGVPFIVTGCKPQDVLQCKVVKAALDLFRIGFPGSEMATNPSKSGRGKWELEADREPLLDQAQDPATVAH